MRESRILGFTRDSDPFLFQKYLSLKYRVFVEELGWDTLPNLPNERVVLEDPHDRYSHFLVALNDADDPIGVARGTLPTSFGTFYRYELYADFFQSACVQQIEGRVSTINAVAVLPEFRRSGPVGQSWSAKGLEPVSDILTRSMVSQLSGMGSVVIVLSVIEGGALSLMRRMGFHTINPPHEFRGSDYSSKPNAKTLRIYDMARALVEENDADGGSVTRSESEKSLIHEIDAQIRQTEANLRVYEPNVQ